MATPLHGKKKLVFRKKAASLSKEPDDPLLTCTPRFFSREDLFALNLGHHVNQIYAHIQDKEAFIQLLLEHFCTNPQVDCQVFRSATFRPFMEASFIQTVFPFSLEQLTGLRIAAVDGGLGFREYLGLQITLVKVSVVTYEFNIRNHPTIRNYPPLHYDENYAFFTDYEAYTETSGSVLAGLRRTLAENTMLLNFLHTAMTLPDLILLDGSLLPPPLTGVIEDNPLLLQNFQACVQSYRNLYEFCESRRILLVGSVKDTRSNVMRNLLTRAFPRFLSDFPSLTPLLQLSYRKLFQAFSDAELTYKLLQPSQRTLAFRYERTVTSHRSVFSSEYREFLDEFPVYASYVQISPFDLPLRIECLGLDDAPALAKKISKIVNILYPLAQINQQCTLPLPQIEAHLRAHIQPIEFNLVVNKLEQGFKLKKLLRFQVEGSHSASPAKTLSMKSFFSTFLSRRHERMDDLFRRS
jgi:hypothetical protein